MPPIAEKSGSGISGCALLINGDLTESSAANTTVMHNEKKMWDGSIRNSIVVVNGSISMTGYIYDSIVIARGSIKLGSYIYNSLVISCDEGDATSVDCSDGYVNRAIVVAKQLKPGSARQCVSFGNSNTDDHRGDQVNALQADYQLGQGASRHEVSSIGRCELGYLHVAGPPRAKEIWPKYVREVGIASKRILNFSAKLEEQDVKQK